MAVVFDANSTADVTANGVTSITSTNLTVGSGSNRALVVQLGFSLQTLSALAVTWDFGGSAQACAVVTGAAANKSTTPGRSELWGLVNPINGAKTLKAAWTGSSDVVMNGVAWTGVNQTGGATSFAHGTSAAATSTTPSLTITSAVGNATMDCVTDTATLSAPTKTQTYLDLSPATISSSGSRAAGASTVTHAWTQDTNTPWVSVGCDIVAAASKVSFPNRASRPAPFKPMGDGFRPLKYRDWH